MKRHFIVSLCCFCLAGSSSNAEQAPNIVFILADDLAWPKFTGEGWNS